MSRGTQKSAGIVEAVMQAGREVSTATILFHAAIAERLGLHPTDHKALDVLLRTGPLTAGALARRTGLSAAAVTGIIDRLEQAGYVRRERDAGDRRRVIVRPAMEARRAREIARLFDPMAGAMARALSSYPKRQLAVIHGYMQRCRTILEEHAQRLRRSRGRVRAAADRG